MRRATSSLAALLSLLLVSVPVSTWACDFSCSTHQAHFDCHISATTSKDDSAMSMPAGMDMGSDHSENSIGPDTVMKNTPGHSMSISPQQDMANQRAEHVTKPEIVTGSIHDHSRSVSSCTHETCSRISVSASPPGADHSQPNSLGRMAVSISSPVNLGINFTWVIFGSSPPKLLTADRLVTILRI